MRRLSAFSYVTTTAVLFSSIALADTPRPCPPDVTCSGMVNVDDLLAVLNNWGPCEDCPEDITNSGSVNVDDLLAVLNNWGSCQFEYWKTIDHQEAFQISIEQLGPEGGLLPPNDFYDRVVQDLDAIRDEIPELEDVIHSPAWLANSLIVDIEPDDLHTVDCLMAYYQGEVVNVLFNTMHVMEFGGQSNAEALAALFEDAPKVNWVDLNALIGGSNTWEPIDLGSGNWRWTVYDGFHDCFDGCDCFRIYTIRTTEEGQVWLVDYEETGLPWCEF